ncbi:RsfA family transcriptional regulator [Jeotgalibacillus sp. ET6]|uniref:RsfA family transcriptional regulator n=1 Tax=Jeotgalibacillus sp. ET6 TaxID=3037260 RepID=UPI002418A4D8|nr:RsfA family transcriptional regulator [Jeotgalibacillus sp. ET6]MDG5471107.1 RsfA family transcriptional regulator [Jeotgalibacillus sp. ET6]
MKQRQDAWMEEDDLILADTVLRHVREGSTQLNAFEEVGDKLNRTSAACGFRWNAVVRQQYEKALDLAKKQRKQRHRLLGKEQSGKKKILYQPQMPSIEEFESIDLPFSDLPPTEPDDRSDYKPSPEYQQEIAREETFSLVRDFQAAQSARQTPISSLSLEVVIAYLQQLGQTRGQDAQTRRQVERLLNENRVLRDQCRELELQVRKLEDQETTMQEDYETLMKIMNRARKLILFDEEEMPTNTFKMDRNGNLEKVVEN